MRQTPINQVPAQFEFAPIVATFQLFFPVRGATSSQSKATPLPIEHVTMASHLLVWRNRHTHTHTKWFIRFSAQPVFWKRQRQQKSQQSQHARVRTAVLAPHVLAYHEDEVITYLWLHIKIHDQEQNMRAFWCVKLIFDHLKYWSRHLNTYCPDI